MICIQIFVSLKITDNTARSALYALQNRMSMKHVSQLKRWEFWELQFSDGSIHDAEALVRDWIGNTAMFMNPNKHHYQLCTAETSLLQSEEAPCFHQANGSIFVYDREDGKGESVLQSLQSKNDSKLSCDGLIHGTWWDVSFADNTSDPKDELVSMAISTNRQHGLFANPHYQQCRIFLHNTE